MNKAITANKLCKVDIKSKKSPQDPNNMDIGTATKSLLSKLHTVSDKLTCRKQCCKFLVATVSKIFEWSPLDYEIIHVKTCLVPRVISTQEWFL